jgi:aspartate aminotransferase
MIVTLPDNPTGTLPSADVVKRVCEVADRHGLLVISDQIYGDLCHDAQVHSPAVDLPERTIITAGLSKSMALGGYRIGFTRLPEGPLGRQMQADLVGVASEVWSSLAAPMQQVAAHVLGEPPEVTAHVAASRRLHHAVASSVHREFIAAGVSCRPPQAAFYLYPDFAALQPTLAGFGVRSGAQLAEFLLEHHGVGVLAGEEFGDDPAALRFRAATSLLYGADPEQRWSALRSDDPTALPWIADSLSHLRQALTALTDG